MSYQCPQCLRLNALKFVSSIELPSDSRSDEITLQLIRCQSCEFIGVTVYEESRRGALDSESYDIRGWRVGWNAFQDLYRQIKSCPAPSNPRCSCPAHRQLGQRNQQGRWIGPPLTEDSQAFIVA